MEPEKQSSDIIEHDGQTDVLENRPSQMTLHDWENEVPEIHFRTYCAVAIFVLLQGAQAWQIVGTAFASSYIAKDLGRSDLATWFPVVANLVQVGTCPFVSFASDLFGSRRYWLGLLIIPAVVGQFVCATSKSAPIFLLGQAIVGLSLASSPLAYAAPSEILPRRSRPLAQGLINAGAAVGNFMASICASASLRHDPSGWRNNYYVGGSLFATALILFFPCYRPLPRRLPDTTFSQKLRKLDLLGCFLLFAGLVLLLVGISIGNNPFPWTNFRPILMIVLGFATLVAFGLWEWYHKTGILGNGLLKSRNVTIMIFVSMLEGFLLISFAAFYPAETQVLFTSDPLEVGLRTLPSSLTIFIVVLPFAWYASKTRDMKSPLFVGFLFFAIALAGMISMTPGSGKVAIFYCTLVGIAIAPLLTMAFSVAQLACPTHLIGTVSAILVSGRAVGATVGPTIAASVLSSKISIYLPRFVVPAVLQAGLPPSSLAQFIPALASGNMAALGEVPGVTPQIIQAGVGALRKAFSTTYRYVWASVLPFAVAGAVLVLFLAKPNNMNYKIDATVEKDLHTHRIDGHDHAAATA